MADPDTHPASLGWWTIHGSTLLTALRDVGEGQDPDLVYAELYANAEIHTAEPDEDD